MTSCRRSTLRHFTARMHLVGGGTLASTSCLVVELSQSTQKAATGYRGLCSVVEIYKHLRDEFNLEIE